MRSLLTLSVLAALAATATAQDPAADPVEADLAVATALKSQLRYAEAISALEAALAHGSASRAQLIELHRMRGELAAGLGDEAAARQSFAHYLSLAPGARLEPGVSPKIATPFAAAQRANDERSFRLDLVASGDQLTIEVTDPSGLLASLGAEAEGRTLGDIQGPPYLYIMMATQGPTMVLARDKFGNVFEQLGPLVATAMGSEGDLPLIRQPLPWAIGGGVLTAAAVAFALLARSDQNELDDLNRRARAEPFTVSYDDIERVEGRGRNRALLANVIGGTAALVSATAIVLWILKPGPAAHATAQPANGGAIVGVGGTF